MNKKFLIGFSGGVDSTVLVHKMLEYKPVLMHFNHQLRDTAKRDEEFCVDFAQKHGLQIFVGTENIEEYCRLNKKSVEEGARECRHNFFNEIMQKYDNSYLCLAHHKNDRVETFTLNLMRGTGINGLVAMKKNDNERKILRPLIDMTKKEIIDYAQKNNIEWVEDETNQEVDYDRNWLRNEIIPSMEKRKPYIKSVSSFISNLEEISDFLNTQALNFIENGFEIENFKKQHIALKKEVVAQLWIQLTGSRYELNSGKINEILKWLEHNRNGSQLKIKDLLLINRNGKISTKENNEITENIPKI